MTQGNAVAEVGRIEPGVQLDHQREAATLALANRPGFDVASLDDKEFEGGLAKITLRQQRMQRILDTVMHEGVHYGNPKDKDDKPVFKKPMLYQAGAEELRTFFRLHLKHMEGSPVIVSTKEYVSVTSTLGIYDNAGRFLGQRSANCNTTEKRFAKWDGKGFIYTDAREMEHGCLTMSEKRAGTLVTREATGATGFFSAEEEMDKALAGQVGPKPQPWSEVEKTLVFAKAARIGIKTGEEFEKFAQEILGRPAEGFFVQVDDVKPLLDAIETRKKGGTPAAAAAPPAVPPATAPADPGQRSAEDVALDLELGKQQS